MNKSEIRQTLITVVACIITGLIVIIIGQHTQKKVAVVDAIKLFNGYKMKQELEAKAGARLQYLTDRADSIKTDLLVKSKSAKVSKDNLKKIYLAYNEARTTLEQAYQSSNQTINSEVWKRLNPALDEYGKKHDLRLIIGANGRGSVLYYNAYYDITEKVIDFVNKKYEEGN